MDVDRIVTLIGALADGFALRHIADPDGATGETFAEAAVDLLEGLTQAV